MRKILIVLISISMLLACSACNGSSDDEIPVEPVPDVPAATNEQLPEEIEEEPVKESIAILPNGPLDLHVKQSEFAVTWDENDFSIIVLSPIYTIGIVNGVKNFPPRFLAFEKPDGTAPFGIGESAYYYNASNNFVYAYMTTDNVDYEAFLEENSTEKITDTGSDAVVMFWNDSFNSVDVILDISDEFGRPAKLAFTLFCPSGTSKEDVIEYAKSELARIESEMVIFDLEQFWTVDMFSSIELFDESNGFGLTLDVSGLIVSVALLESIHLYSEKDGSFCYVIIDTYGGDIPEGYKETITPAGNTVFFNEGETSLYAYYKIKIPEDNSKYYLRISADSLSDTPLAIVDDIIERITGGYINTPKASSQNL